MCVVFEIQADGFAETVCPEEEGGANDTNIMHMADGSFFDRFVLMMPSGLEPSGKSSRSGLVDFWDLVST